MSSATQTATMIAIAIAHSLPGAFSFPPAGSPKSANSASPTTITAAPTISLRPMCWPVRK